MKILLFFSFLLAACLAQANKTRATAPEATIKLLSLREDVANFEVNLTNATDASIFVEESGTGLHDLHVVSLDLEVKPGRWIYIGPKLDAAASSVFELLPGRSVSRNISLDRLGKSYLRLLKAPQARYRARLRYFPSRDAWLSFGKTLGHDSKFQPSFLIALPSSR